MKKLTISLIMLILLAWIPGKVLAHGSHHGGYYGHYGYYSPYTAAGYYSTYVVGVFFESSALKERRQARLEKRARDKSAWTEKKKGWLRELDRQRVEYRKRKAEQ